MKDYLSAVDGIIFLVDAADRTRFQEAQLTLETEEMETPTSKNMDEAKDGEGFALCRLCTSILFGMKAFRISFGFVNGLYMCYFRLSHETQWLWPLLDTWETLLAIAEVKFHLH